MGRPDENVVDEASEKSIEHQAVAAQSSNVLALAPLFMQLHKDGKLNIETQFFVIQELRKKMLAKEVDIDLFLKDLLNYPEWQLDPLVNLLLNANVYSTPGEDHPSLLHSAIPNYLPVLLSLKKNLVIPLINALFQRPDAAGKTGIQKLVEARDFDSLALIFSSLKTHKITVSHVESLASLFEKASMEMLLAFARAKGGEPTGFKFHALVGIERIMKLKPAEILQLIDALLTTNANSDGVALYLRYVDAHPEIGAKFHNDFLELQRKKMDGNCSYEFVMGFTDNRNLITDVAAQQFLRHCNRVELSHLATECFRTWVNAHDQTRLVPSIFFPKTEEERYYALGSKSKKERGVPVNLETNPYARRDYAENRFLTILSSRKADVGYLLGETPVRGVTAKAFWARLFVLAADNIPMVIQHWRDEGAAIDVMSVLIKSVQYYHDRAEAILKQLTPAETQALIDFSVPTKSNSKPDLSVADILSKAPRGKVSFDSWSRFLYNATTKTGNLNTGYQYPNEMLSKTRAGDEFKLVRDLLKYRFKRDEIHGEYYFSFLGFSSGYSKKAKLEAVNKVLTHIYGTDAEKMAAGPFTQEEKNILYQGDLGITTRLHSATMERIIMNTVKRLAPPEPISSPTAGSSGAS